MVKNKCCENLIENLKYKCSSSSEIYGGIVLKNSEIKVKFSYLLKYWHGNLYLILSRKFSADFHKINSQGEL